MRGRISALLLLAMACSDKAQPVDPGPGTPPVQMTEIPVPPYMGSNPVDAATHALFFREGHTPVRASKAELCRRLFADLIGRYPTSADISGICQSEPLVIVRDLQSRDAYLHHSQRFWRDRMNTNDGIVNWRYLKSLYELVDQLQRGDVTYGAFVTKAAAHPGFVMSEVQPADRARAAFRAFLGREASDAEAADFASLYRPWIPIQVPDPDIPFTAFSQAVVFPVVCQPLLHCSAKLLGGGDVDLRGSGTDQIAYADLRDWQREQLEEIGRVLARQPVVWEAAADGMLNRFLAWSDGGRNPREPGIVIPEVRQSLAEYIAENGDYPGAEAMLLTSFLYTQSAQVEPDGFGDDPNAVVPPVWASGPVKPAMAEVWLDSLRPLFSADLLGTCDPRYTDGGAYFGLFQAAQTGTITPARLESELARVHAMLGDRRRFRLDDNSGLMIPDFQYEGIARQIGGCPGFATTREPPDGMAFAFTQESLAEQICFPTVATEATPPSDPTLENILSHQMRLLFAREPAPEEIDAFASARATCTGDDCTVQAAVNSVCVGLLGSAEFLFY